MGSKELNPIEIYKKLQDFSCESLLYNIEDESKIEQFEKALSGRIDQCDSLSEAVEKIVRAALLIEFGEKIIKGRPAENMIATISHGILGDDDLRKQALIVIDRFAKTQELNA